MLKVCVIDYDFEGETLHILTIGPASIGNRQITPALEQEPAFQCNIRTATSYKEAYLIIRQSPTPFDLFLVDQESDLDLDCIEVVKELQRLSPTSDVIVLAEAGDHSMSERALSAGACRYLYKPINADKLLLELRMLCNTRAAMRERDRLKILIDIALRARNAQCLDEAGRVIVQHSLRFGFQYAQLWRCSPDGDRLIRMAEASDCVQEPSFECLPPTIKSTSAERVLKSFESVVYEEENVVFDDSIARALQLPACQWVYLPLRSANRNIGLLALGSFQNIFQGSLKQYHELTLLGAHVAISLEQALLQEQQQIHKALDEQIKRAIRNGDLDLLLLHIRRELGRLIDVRNFTVALCDDDRKRLDLRLRIEHNRREQRILVPCGTGLVGHVIQHNQALLLPRGGKAYREKHGIELYGHQSRSWLGVPLCVNNRVIGAIVVQSYKRTFVFTEQHCQLLLAVANQVAGAIQTLRLKENAEEHWRKEALVQQYGELLLEQAGDNEQWLWHTTLTMATAGSMLGFDRAMLLLLDKNAKMLRGYMGAERFDQCSTQDSFAYYPCGPFSFNQPVQPNASYQSPAVDINTILGELNLPTQHLYGAFSSVLQTGQRIVLAATEAKYQLPSKFVSRVGVADCAVLPIQIEGRRIGLLVVDNIHNGQRLRRAHLNQVEMLLTQAALICKHLRQRQASDGLAITKSQLFEQAIHSLLRATLESPPVDFTKHRHTAHGQVATTTMLEFYRLRREGMLHEMLDATQSVFVPQNLEAMLDTLLLATKRIAPEVDAATTWYKDPEREMIIPGPHFGVRNPEPILSDKTTRSNVLNRMIIMAECEPSFTRDIYAIPSRLRYFTYNEEISPSFVLLYGNVAETENTVLDTMLFNYRQSQRLISTAVMIFPGLKLIMETTICDPGRLVTRKNGIRYNAQPSNLSMKPQNGKQIMQNPDTRWHTVFLEGPTASLNLPTSFAASAKCGISGERHTLDAMARRYRGERQRHAFQIPGSAPPMLKQERHIVLSPIALVDNRFAAQTLHPRACKPVPA